VGAVEATQVLNHSFAKIYNVLNRIEQIYKYDKNILRCIWKYRYEYEESIDLQRNNKSFITLLEATRPVNIGWVRWGTRKTGHCGDGPEAARKCRFRSGAYHKVPRRIVLGTTAAEDGYGPTHLAQFDLTSSVNTVSTLFIFWWYVRPSFTDNESFALSEPRACGRPEQPPNATMIVTTASAKNPSIYEVGATVEYSCNAGSLLIGPASRTCLDTGFYNEFPPVCKSKYTKYRGIL